MPVGGAPAALRAALLGPRGGSVPRQRILKQLTFRGSPGTAASITEMPVLALAGLRKRATLERQWRRLVRQKPRLPQQHRSPAAGDTGTYADGMPRIGDMDMRDRAGARSSALHLIHLAPPFEPGEEFYHRHEPASTECGQCSNPK